MKEILIGGYYGGGNLGDEAILAAILQDLRNLDPSLKFSIVSWDPHLTQKEHEVKAVYWRDIEALVEASRKADLILVGGGGLFQDHWGLDPDTYLRVDHGGISTYGSLPLLAEMTGTPCMLYGVGIGPLQSEIAREHTRLAAERCRLVIVRDQTSSRLLLETGYQPREGAGEVEVTADPAFGFSTATSAEEEVNGLLESLGISLETPLLAVSLRYWDLPQPPEEWLPGVARGLTLFKSTLPELEMVLIPFQISQESPYTDDLGLCRGLSQLLPEEIQIHLITENLSPSTCQELISRCSLVLGMRLHALIMAVNMRVPVVALPYDPKVKSLMEEAGLGDFCLPSYGPSSYDLSCVLTKVWEERKGLKEKMSVFAEEQERKARSNARLALELLEGAGARSGPNLRSRVHLRWIKARTRMDRRLGRGF
jgi:polysaccharide pyruvyl transferase CsaB